MLKEGGRGITDDDEYDLQSGFAHLHRQETYIKIHVRHQLAYDIWCVLELVRVVRRGRQAVLLKVVDLCHLAKCVETRRSEQLVG